jgi:hypothetical protein
MQNAVFIAGIENLTFRTTPGRGDVVADAFSFTTDAAFIERLIPIEAQPSIGHLELSSLKNGRPVAYTKPPTPFQSESDAHQDLINWLRLITVFLQHSWFVKDNAGGLELGYVIWSMRGQILTIRNFLGLVTTDAALTIATQALTTDEFRRTRELFNRDVAEPAISGKRQTKVTRLDRAKYFIQSARVAPHLPVKIANYCTALEALFSNDASELTHKLSERAAWFIGRNADERIDIFRKIKKAYGIRSKVVHGVSDWGTDMDLARDTSLFLDQTLRRVFTAISNDQTTYEMFVQDSEPARRKHEDYFLALVMAGGPDDRMK